VIVDVDPRGVEELVGALEAMDLMVRPGALRRAAMACMGSEFCKIAVVETKNRTERLVRELERRLPELTEPIRINMNGCPNSCARFQLGDIGLLGPLMPGLDGDRVEGFQVHIGGHLGPEAAVARRVKGVRVRSTDLDDYLEGVLRCFLDTREEREPFHRWAARAEDAWLPPREVSAL